MAMIMFGKTYIYKLTLFPWLKRLLYTHKATIITKAEMHCVRGLKFNTSNGIHIDLNFFFLSLDWWNLATFNFQLEFCVFFFFSSLFFYSLLSRCFPDPNVVFS